MLLYVGENEQGLKDPLLQTATHRGRLMELLAVELIEGGSPSAQSEAAFLVGMLSLVDALLGRPAEEIIPELHLEDDVQSALLKGDGILGRLLKLVKLIEKADFDGLERDLSDLNLDIPTLQRCENEAHAWVHELSQDYAPREH